MKKPHTEVFTHKKLGFTKFVEETDVSWKIKIISNIDSELIFEREIQHLFQLDYLNMDITLALDKYITLNRGEHEAIGEFLKGWNL